MVVWVEVSVVVPVVVPVVMPVVVAVHVGVVFDWLTNVAHMRIMIYDKWLGDF